MGTPADYLAAAHAINSGATQADEVAVAPGACIRDSIVWRGAMVGEHASLDRCVVTNVAVPAGFSAKDAVLVPASVCRDDDRATITGAIACFPIDR